MTQTITPTRWVGDLPLDVRLALAACEDAGVGIDEYSTGSNRPVFYEIKADFLGCSTSMGAVMGMVTDAITTECRRWGVPQEHISTICDRVRHAATGPAAEGRGDYHARLNQMMCWVGVASDDED